MGDTAFAQLESTWFIKEGQNLKISCVFLHKMIYSFHYPSL